MPALPNVPGVLRITLVQDLGEDTDVINRLFQSYTGGPPSAQALDHLASVIATAWGTLIAPDSTPDLALTGVNIEDLTSPTAASIEHSVSPQIPGTNGGGKTGAGTAFCISNLIARRYRGGHPRTYLAGKPASALLDEQTWLAASVNSWVSDWSTFVAGMAGTYSGIGATYTVVGPVSVSYFAGFTNVLYPSGRYHAVPNRRGTPIVDSIFGFRGNHKVASQRRRNLQSR